MNDTSDTAVPPDLAPASRNLRARLSPERWAVVVALAHERVRILDETAAQHASGLSRRRALAAVAPDVEWPTYLHWCRVAKKREGAPWERQLDARVPPPPERVPDDVRLAAIMLRRGDRTIRPQVARQHLIAQFGPERGHISNASLRRIWKAEGLQQPRGGFRSPPHPPGKVTDLSGGAGLALLGAAAVETGVIEALGRAVVEHTKAVVAAQPQGEQSDLDALRDEQGRFTGAYNRAVRGAHEEDPRRAPEATKRRGRRLDTLAIAKSSPATVGHKLLAMGATALVTERRGFDGLEGPSGAWLEALGGAAYQDTTLDKCLAELALVDAGDVLWTAHAQLWQRVTKPWSLEEGAPPWLQFALYVDATQEPYWPDAFAVSGKVSHVGQVMPCLTRIALMGGPGVPLLVKTFAGSASLAKEVIPLLDRTDAVLGKSEVGRLTILDAEACQTPLLQALVARPDTWFITVLKGSTARSAERSEEGDWQPYRAHDQIRPLTVTLGGDLRLRAVEMVRKGSRHPTPTVFLTNTPEADLPLESVPTGYLSRWPHQEQRFRDGRNGIGLDRTHGYSGEWVTHVALATAEEKNERSVKAAQKRVERTVAVEKQAHTAWEAAPRGKRGDARKLLNTATRARKAAERHHKKVNEEKARLSTTQREIYVRDTTRDGLATCAKLTVFMLLEFVLKEYFGGQRMEPRTFIDLFVTAPVSIRETKRERHFRIRGNPRSPEATAALHKACAEITRRQIVTHDGKKLRFEVVEGGGS